MSPSLDSNTSNGTASYHQVDSTVNNAFKSLVEDLSAALGPSSGLDSDDVDPHDIERLMEKYVSNEKEWGAYAMADSSKSYTRNLVDEGNGKSNLLILVWSPGKESTIHDHANAHCVMKILKGSLKETLYSWPEKSQAFNSQNSRLQVTKETVYMENQVTYMSDQLGLHRISNIDPKNYAISLHRESYPSLLHHIGPNLHPSIISVYTPPNAANYGFSIFDERTGKSSHIKQCDFYSRQGVKV